MVFLLNLIFSLGYSYTVGRFYGYKKCKSLQFFIIFSPLFIIWLLICGLQNNVGSDYPTYISLFKGYDLERYEPGFVAIVNYYNSINIYGQTLYFVFYSIGFFFLFLLLRRFELRYLYLFIFLYLCVSGLFHNQLNILRQVIATYIGTYGAILIINKKRLNGIFFIIIAATIHYSALILLLVLFFKYLKSFDSYILIIFVGIALALSILMNVSIIERMNFLIPTNYIRFINGASIEERGIILKATKYILVPIYILAIQNYKNNIKQNSIQENLYKIGIIAFCLKLSMLNLTIISRLFDVFIIFSLYPLFYYLKNLIIDHSYYKFSFLITFLLFIYLSKILIFPSGEYLYNSIITEFL